MAENRSGLRDLPRQLRDCREEPVDMLPDRGDPIRQIAAGIAHDAHGGLLRRRRRSGAAALLQPCPDLRVLEQPEEFLHLQPGLGLGRHGLALRPRRAGARHRPRHDDRGDERRRDLSTQRLDPFGGSCQLLAHGGLGTAPRRTPTSPEPGPATGLLSLWSAQRRSPKADETRLESPFAAR